MCKHIFHTCNKGIYPTYALHMQNYMCNTGIYHTPVLHA